VRGRPDREKKKQERGRRKGQKQKSVNTPLQSGQTNRNEGSHLCAHKDTQHRGGENKGGGRDKKERQQQKNRAKMPKRGGWLITKRARKRGSSKEKGKANKER